MAHYDPLQLILMRHAKSDWSNEALSDHDRPLNKRGRRDAPRMGDWLASEGYLPDLILCSTATRTRETIELVAGQWPEQVPICYSSELYHASADDVLAIIRSDSADARRVLVLGHNPAMEMLAGHFAGRHEHFPTAAVVVFELDCDDWAELHGSRSVNVLAIQRPKEL